MRANTRLETLDAVRSSAIPCFPIDIATAVSRPYQDMVITQQIRKIRVPRFKFKDHCVWAILSNVTHRLCYGVGS